MITWLYLILQLLLALVALAAGLATLLAALTKLIRAIMGLIREIRQSRAKPLVPDPKADQRDSAVTHSTGGDDPNDGPLRPAGRGRRMLRRMVLRERRSYIEAQPRPAQNDVAVDSREEVEQQTGND